jgi:DNA polymerase-3 subunit alpha
MPKKTDDFVGLHQHSDMSQLDGCGKIGDYVKTAKERGHKAIAFTEHGTMRGYHTLLLASKEHDIKPIYGIEFYVCSDMARKGASPDEKAALIAGKTFNRSEQNALVREFEAAEGLRANWHMCAWAESKEGLKNLFRLSSASWIDGFYYKPRIDIKTLVQYNEGVRIGSACTSGLFNQQNHLGRTKRALEMADQLYAVFGDRMWLEIMPHNFPEQVVANKFTLELFDRYNGECRLLATQDAHYVLQDDWRHHEVLLAIGTNDKMSNPDRFRFTGTEFHFRTRLEMIEAFRKSHGYLDGATIKQALDNTMLFSEGCNVEIERYTGPSSSIGQTGWASI